MNIRLWFPSSTPAKRKINFMDEDVVEGNKLEITVGREATGRS